MNHRDPYPFHRPEPHRELYKPPLLEDQDKSWIVGTLLMLMLYGLGVTGLTWFGYRVAELVIAVWP